MDAFVCSTYYHVLITALKAMSLNEKADVFVLDNVEDGETLCTRMKKSKLFHAVFYVKAPSKVYNKTITDKLFWQLRCKNIIESELPYDFHAYKECYLYMDDTWLANYFKVIGFHYNVIEDSIDAFKHILNTRYARLVDYRKSGKVFWLWKLFPYAEGNYKFFLDSPCVKTIEVNSKEGIILPDDERIIEVPRKELFAELENNEKLNTVLDIFLNDRNIISGENIAIIFTSPFWDDGLVDSEEEQLKLYIRLISNYSKDYQVLIKAHPRDKANYESISGVTVLPRCFPSELIYYLDSSVVKKYVSIASHCVDIYPAEKTDYFEFQDYVTDGIDEQ